MHTMHFASIAHWVSMSLKSRPDFSRAPSPRRVLPFVRPVLTISLEQKLRKVET
jgi:hypothetical protein